MLCVRVLGAVLCLACVRCAWCEDVNNYWMVLVFDVGSISRMPQNKHLKYKSEKNPQQCGRMESVDCFASPLPLLLFSRVTTSLKYDTPEARKEGHVARTNKDNRLSTTCIRHESLGCLSQRRGVKEDLPAHEDGAKDGINLAERTEALEARVVHDQFCHAARTEFLP